MFRSSANLTLRHIQKVMREDTNVLSLLDPWVPSLHCVYKPAPPSHSPNGLTVRDVAIALVISREWGLRNIKSKLDEFKGIMLAIPGVEEAYAQMYEPYPRS